MSSGLGGMSGAQGKAGVISNAIAVIAEINGFILCSSLILTLKKLIVINCRAEAALKKRHEQGWIDVVIKDIPTLFDTIRKARKEKSSISIGYHVKPSLFILSFQPIRYSR